MGLLVLYGSVGVVRMGGKQTMVDVAMVGDDFLHDWRADDGFGLSD